MKTRLVLALSALILMALVSVTAAQLQFQRARDPGTRGGPAGAGGPLPGLNASQLTFFEAGQEDSWKPRA